MCDRSELEALQAEYAGQLMALTMAVTFIIRQPSVNIAASLIRQTSDGSVTESFRKEAHEFSERRGYTARQSPNSRSKIMHQDPTDLSGRYRISRHAIDESAGEELLGVSGITIDLSDCEFTLMASK